MNIPQFITTNTTNFKAFKIKDPSYLKNNCSTEDILSLSKDAEHIQNTKHFDLEVREDGFTIVNKKTKETYSGDLEIRTHGPYGEATYLENRDKKLTRLNDLKSYDYYNAISTFKAPIDNYPGKKYIYYTYLLERNENNKMERIQSDCFDSTDIDKKIAKEIEKEKALRDLLKKYGS